MSLAQTPFLFLGDIISNPTKNQVILCLDEIFYSNLQLRCYARPAFVEREASAVCIQQCKSVSSGLVKIIRACVHNHMLFRSQMLATCCTSHVICSLGPNCDMRAIKPSSPPFQKTATYVPNENDHHDWQRTIRLRKNIYIIYIICIEGNSTTTSRLGTKGLQFAGPRLQLTFSPYCRRQMKWLAHSLWVL